jgi:hypothetical protein
MKSPICDFILDHFPEIINRMDHNDLDSCYLVANELANWFAEQVDRDWKRAKERILTFYEAAAPFPGGDDASNDMMTILQVGFFEHLWQLPNAAKTVPALTSHEYIVESRDYLRQWVGMDRYEAVVKAIDPMDYGQNTNNDLP